jgi:hypothetical protein
LLLRGVCLHAARPLFLSSSLACLLASGSAQVKVALRGAVYAKALKLGPGARQRTTVGAMNNLMQLDATRVGDFASVVHTLWDGALQIVLCTWLLGKLLGPAVTVSAQTYFYFYFSIFAYTKCTLT